MVIRRICFSLVGLASTLWIGCAGQPAARGVPDWLIHVPRQIVAENASLEGTQDRLIYELNQSQLPSNYIPPEQLAKFAKQLIDEGYPLDATIYLAAASYTYHRQAFFAVTEAERNAPKHLANATKEGVDLYWEFVVDEYRTFRELDFNDPIKYTIALWEKKKKVFEHLEKEMEQMSGALGASSIERQAALRDEIFKKIETARAPTWDKLKYPQVADALLRRLKADLENDQFQYNAAHHLAAVPFKPFLLAGLHNTPHPFMVPLCRSISERFAVYETDVLEALSATNAYTRSNAALLLGLQRNDKYIEALNSAYQSEANDIVKWSMEYAILIAQDNPIAQNNPEKTAAARAVQDQMRQSLYGHTLHARDEEHIDHLVQLYEWMPDDALDGIDVTWLHNVASSSEQSTFSRSFALATLGNIGKAKALSEATLNLMLTLSDNEDDNLAEWAHGAVIQQQSLDKKTVVQRLSNPSAGKDALLERMLVLTEEKDQEFWNRQSSAFSSQSETGKKITIWGVFRSNRENAADKLSALFDAHNKYRFDIALAYASIPGISKEQLLTLAGKDSGAGSTFLYFAAEQRDTAVQQFAKLLESAAFEDKLVAAKLAKMFIVKEQLAAIGNHADYFDNRYYPHDAILRNLQLDALLTISVYQAFEQSKYEFNTPTSVKK